MSNYAWLYNYTSHYVANTYGIVIQTENYNGAEKFHLEEKKKCNSITIEDLKTLESINEAETKFWQAWKNYDFIPSQEMPIKLFKKPDVDHYYNLPKTDDIFFIITNGYLVIDKKLHDIISKFNLGKTHFSEVYIYDIETKERLLDIPYYFINMAEVSEFLDIDNSSGIKANFYQPDHPVRSIGISKDDDIKLLISANSFLVDLWHDPKLRDSLFFSDRLAQALFEIGFTQKKLGLIRCIIQ